MAAEQDPLLEGLSEAQRAAAAHPGGCLLVIGVAGSGRSEALARRLAILVQNGESCLALTSSCAACSRIRHRAEELISTPYEELHAYTLRDAAERLLREHGAEAGIDPFFASIGAADRLAMLLERIEELPLRRHEIRGNPAGLLAHVITRIDALKQQAVTAAELAEHAREREAAAGSEAERDAARRDAELAELYRRHDELVRAAGALDAGDVVMELARLLAERPAIRARIADRFPHLLIDELEDAGPARRALLEPLLGAAESAVAACDDDQGAAGEDAAAWFERASGGAERIVLEGPARAGGPIADAAHAVIAPRSGSGSGAPAPSKPRAARGPEGEVRFWRCGNERAQAQAVARELEALLASGEVGAEEICVAVPSAQRDARPVAAALEERGVPYRLSGPAAFFLRSEVRDVIAWLRLLADPADAAAAVRVLTRPPVALRSVDLARVMTIARRRKLDTVSALEASLDSPQVPPDARDRVQGFLKLYGAAARAMGATRADVFVRRLIERVGFRRQQLFAAHPDAAERLLSLSRLGELAAAWTRREPNGSNRDFVRYLAAISEAGVPAEDAPPEPAPGAVRLLDLGALKGLEFERVYLLGLTSAACGSKARRALYVAMTRARGSLCLSWPEHDGEIATRPSPLYEDARAVLGAEEEIQEEELFGPAEGLHATYRMIRDEVMDAAWRSGGALGELRLDTQIDVARAVARFLELIKLGALIQRPSGEPPAEALRAINDLLGQVVSPEQRQELLDSGLDDYLLDAEREADRRRELISERQEPSLQAFLPRRGEGLALSATDIDLYLTCPLKYKFARVFGIPREQTINQRFGIVIHQVLERYHADPRDGESEEESLERLMSLFGAAWRRAGFGETPDELQFRERAIAALRRYHARHTTSPSSPVWLERGFDFRVGPHHLRGRVDRVDELPGGGYELIDYKTGDPKPPAELAGDLQLAIYRLAAREAWQVEAEAGSYWYVLADEKVAVERAPDDAERVERTVLGVGEGIMGQDFEPRPSPEVCSWCDFRLVCPASEA